MLHYRKHKIRIDRGRMWYSTFNALFTAILVTIFTAETRLIDKIIAGVASMVLVYFFGYVDDKLKLLDREQNEYYRRNPYMENIVKELEEIKKKLDES